MRLRAKLRHRPLFWDTPPLVQSTDPGTKVPEQSYEGIPASKMLSHECNA